MNTYRAEMGRAVLNNVNFWKKFLRFTGLGVATIFLIVFASQTINSTGMVFAENPVPIPPPPPPPVECSAPEFKYNQCVACNTSQPVYQDSCGNYTTGPDQPDAGCASWCEAPAPTPTPLPTCSAPEFKYNQCVACNTSQPVYQDSCGNYTTGPDQPDSACGSWCEAPTPSPTAPPPPPPPPSQIVCNDNEVSLHVAPNPSNIGQGVNFSISGDASTWIGDNFSGGVTNCSGPWNSINCTASQAGNFTWTHTWKHCVGSFDNCSNLCSKSINFSVNSPQPTPTATPSPTPTATPSPTATPKPTATPSPTATPKPTVTPAPTAPPQGALTCPVGSIAQMRDNVLVCVVNTNTNTNNNTNTSTSTSSSSNTNNITFGNIGAGTPAVVTPAVVTTTGQVLGVKELPKTGLPAIAWSALAFIPAGFRLRKLGQIKKDLQDDPQFMWEDRKFKAGA